MRIRGLLFVLVSPAFVACMPQQPPLAAPVAEAPSPPDERVVVSTVTVGTVGTPAGEAAQAPRASDADRVRPEPVFFRLGAGYGAVGRIDLSPCKDRGLDTGYVHMHVTFGEGGSIARAVIESPTQPPPEALACIGELLEEATVPPFQGGDVTLSKSLFVASQAPNVPTAPGGEIFVKSDSKSRSGARPLTLR
jgi:hypothetical protein